MFERMREHMANWLSPRTVTVPAVRPPQKPMSLARMYAAAKQSRLTQGWGTQTTSEDSELKSSLPTMRDRSRALIRDAAYAKRAKTIVQNNVIGSGIGLQAKVMNSRGMLNERVNDEIEETFERWCCAESCHVGGALHFSDIERMLVGETFEAGEIFVRLHYRAMGDSTIPLSLEVIEPERLADSYTPAPSSGLNVRMGVELDAFHRAQAYWIRTVHPGETRLTAEQTTKVERVPAEDIIHLRIIERWPQTRGVPWMHAAMRRLNDMDGLSESEIVAARAAACYMGFIELPNADTQYGDQQADGSMQSELEPAIIERLNPGEKFTFAAPNRPNSQLDPFMRMMLREVAAGTGPSYESVSRDYSQSNYSSSRLALLDDRDLWRTLQQWFIRQFRMAVHRKWMRMAVMSGALKTISLEAYALDPEAYERARFKPRGWSWIDPTKEVAAYKEAIKAGLTTQTEVIAMTGNGRDLYDVFEERKRELELAEEMGLSFDTDPVPEVETPDPAATAGTPEADNETDDAEDPAVGTAEKMLKAASNQRGS